MADMKDRMLLNCTECGSRHDLQVPTGVFEFTCVNCDSINEIPRYTLPEAARILARMTCDREGHVFEYVNIHHDHGQILTSMIRCERCTATFSEDPK